MRMQRGNWNDMLVTVLTAGTGVALLAVALGAEVEGRDRVVLLLGGMGGMVAAGRHRIAALVLRLRRRG